MNQLVGRLAPIPVVSNRSYADPDTLVRRWVREFVRVRPNLTETTISGVHFIDADSPAEIGTAVAQFVRTLRAA
jgi:haloalkane dehalogenase